MNKLKSLGPGLLYAGAAIGVSHIVQSTRAGAEYGYVLILAIIIVHIFMYPFFVLGPRYTNLSGQNLIQGFAKLHPFSLWLILGLSLLTMFSIQAAVTVVTAGLAIKLTGIAISPAWWSAILLLICLLILQIGKFSVLDNLMKVIMVILAVSTLLAVAFSFGLEKIQIGEAKIFNLSKKDDLGFLITFIGWMPAPLDIAIWHSIWTAAKYMNRGKNDLKTENFDFNVGFYGTAFLAICFVILGANTLYHAGINLETSAAGFASQLIDIYTLSLGSWSYYLIIIAAFTTMFSTTLTCFDAIPRVMQEIGLQAGMKTEHVLTKRWLWMLILGAGAVIILLFFVDSMRQMVSLATIVSFLTAPILALLSYQLVRKHKSEFVIWTKSETRLAFAGLVFLSVLSIYYIISLI